MTLFTIIIPLQKDAIVIVNIVFKLSCLYSKQHNVNMLSDNIKNRITIITMGIWKSNTVKSWKCKSLKWMGVWNESGLTLKLPFR